MKPFLCLLLAFSLCYTHHVFAQDKSPVKYGAISEKDFTITQTLDSGTAAVVIADIGSTSFDGNSKGWFSLVFKHYRRIKILNKNGFDMADVAIHLYSQGTSEERLTDLKAHTYNMEGGKLVETKLDAASVFKDKLSKHVLVKKFTFPAVKEGSIIEYSYTITSDFLFNLQPWEFQGKYPRLWSEYNVKMPQFFNYVFLKQGYLKYDISTSKESFQSFSIVYSDDPTSATQTYNISGSVRDLRWVIKDVPALKEEKYTSTLDNYLSKISFQLSEYRFPDMPPKQVMGNWFTVAEELLKDEDFGDGLDKPNGWLDNDIKTICAGATTPLDKAKKIYAFVRDNFTCTDHDAYYRSNPLKQVFSKKNGNVADINLLLLIMLRHEGIDADPVLLSTRDNGFTYEMYPILSRFNYVVCRLRLEDHTTWYLDASHDYLGFGRLPEDCYNGHSRVINAKLPEIVYFYPDSLTEMKTTAVFIASSETDKSKMEGSFQSRLGYFESAALRQELKTKGEAAYFKKVKSDYSFDVDIKAPALDSLPDKEKPLTETYMFTFDKPADGMLYINPMMGEGLKDNFFKSAQRFYPVEMPCAMDETYVFNMEIPDGYEIEEIPKSARVSFNGTEGMFEYLVDKADNHVRLMSHIKLNKATFQPDEYESLRDFFGYIVKKHAEQVVLKKK